jgi:hypothetical protein
MHEFMALSAFGNSNPGFTQSSRTYSAWDEENKSVRIQENIVYGPLAYGVTCFCTKYIQ